jgi:hypothetical protein
MGKSKRRYQEVFMNKIPQSPELRQQVPCMKFPYFTKVGPRKWSLAFANRIFDAYAIKMHVVSINMYPKHVC